jgi:hypothetical protein
MWRKLKPISTTTRSKASGLVWVLSAMATISTGLPSLARADDPPKDLQQCPLTVQKPTGTSGTEEMQDRDCVEIGGAIGEMGLSWRSKLPGQVQWLTRKDAAHLCKQTQTDWGQKVGKPIGDGCVFLSEKVCTIITTAYTASALIGNAVRDCTP